MEELRQEFLALQDEQGVAAMVGVDLNRLHYHLYIVSESARYRTFQIPKKSGGMRTISAPATALRMIQRKLADVLLATYGLRVPVHSFVRARDIRSNAEIHSPRRNVLNIDLEDFFPTINFGRVRGLFMGKPYSLNESVSTILAQICCFNNTLPQGAPTSPIVSNMMCGQLDSQLLQLARENRCAYTRYADDMTFSTNLKQFPTALAEQDEEGGTRVGEELERLIGENGFTINTRKVRLQHRSRRQEVTGLVVNEFPNVRRRYIRRVRGMLHAWEKHGLEAAQKRHFELPNQKYRNPDKQQPSFGLVLQGRISFIGAVRGQDDSLYLKLRERLRNLNPELVKEPVEVAPEKVSNLPAIVIHGEGKTDWKHLKAALRDLQEKGQYTGLSVEFDKAEGEPSGSDPLLKKCETFSKAQHPRPRVFIFDRDEKNIIKKVSGRVGLIKDWGNQVYSFAIPVPRHRKKTPEVCVELYYSDKDLTREDTDGRRVFLSNEFDPKSGIHKNLDLVCQGHHKNRGGALTIVASEVYNRSSVSVALSKSDFGDSILDQKPGFDNIDFSAFKAIFDAVVTILNRARVESMPPANATGSQSLIKRLILGHSFLSRRKS